MNCKDGRTVDNNPVISAFFENDLPSFKKQYTAGEIETHIDFDNWRNQPLVWQRKKRIFEKNKTINEG